MEPRHPYWPLDDANYTPIDMASSRTERTSKALSRSKKRVRRRNPTKTCFRQQHYV